MHEAINMLKNLVANAPPDDWEPYDAFGDYVDTDVSNAGDVHGHGYTQGYWDAAKVVRKALKLLEAEDA